MALRRRNFRAKIQQRATSVILIKNRHFSNCFIASVQNFFILNKDAALMCLAMNLYLFTVTLPAIAAQAVDTLLLREYNV